MDGETLDGLYARHVDALAERYAATLTRLGWDGVVLHAGSPVKRSEFDDQFWPLRVTPHFQHWLALNEPDAGVIVRVGRTPLLFRALSGNFWERLAPPESRAFEGLFDQVSVREWKEVRAHLGPGRVAFVGETRGAGPACVDDSDRVNPAELVAALDSLRTLKTPYEVACLAEANRRAALGHRALREAFRDSRASEIDLHLSYLKATSQDDAETPYKNIVALGAHAATLHHVAYGRDPGRHDAESLLVDAGATCRGYCADVTRTWVRGNGAAASTFAQLVAQMDTAQRRLSRGARVGRPYETLHDESHREVAAVLRDTGVLQGSVDEIVESGVTRSFYPHGLGHSLGLQTHDVGCGLRRPRSDNPFLRNTSEIAVDQVFTIEPGVYFIPELLAEVRAGPHAALVDWTLVQALAPLGGVRVEDDVHVVEAAAVRNLTREHLQSGGGVA